MYRPISRAMVLPALAVVLCASSARAADSVTGTFTVKGKTHLFKQVAVTKTSNPAEPGSQYLVVLVSDVAVAAADQKPARLAELARDGKLRAVRVVWKEGFDSLTATPYHNALEDNGQPTTGGAQIDLQAYDDKRLEAQINSKALGQDWHFKATLKAAIGTMTSTAEDFRDPAPVVAPGGVEREKTSAAAGTAGAGAASGAGAKDSTALKRTLGKLGYEYTGEAFSHAVKDGNLDAVTLFLQIGMSPDSKDSLNTPVLMSAVTQCTSEPSGNRIEIVKALLAAKAAVDPKDQNGSTPLLWSVTAQCPTDFARALLAAGANPNVKAKGGGTPLMLAKVFQRADLIALLEKAGAKQ
jgi:hypothetical protein